MKLILQLSGEHPRLPAAELAAVHEGEGIPYEVFYSNERLVCIEAKTKSATYLQRLSMTLSAAEYVIFSEDLDEVAYALAKKLKEGSRVAVRSKSNTLEKALGRKMKDLGHAIDLVHPEYKIICHKTDKKHLVGIEIPLKRTYSARRPQFRPFFHPTSMHPKLARALVNLARVRKGDSVLDPFCGTGGILIEAGLSGMGVHGSDIDKKMVAGCRKNLESYGLEAELKQCDALEIGKCFSSVDAVVTDPPYARSSFSSEKNLRAFYSRFLTSARNVLKDDGFLVFMIPSEYDIAFPGFRMVEEFSLKVHKSLTRRIIVLQKAE